LFIVSACLLFAASATAQIKVGVVDVQRALLSTEDGMRAAKSLSNYTSRKQAELKRVEAKLQREQKQLELQARVLSRAAFARRYEHWQRRVIGVQAKTVEFNRLLQRKQQQLLGPISQKLVKAVRRVARKRGFDVVVDRAVAPYARADLDVTDMVVRMYNSGGSDKAEPPNGGAAKGGEAKGGEAKAPKDKGNSDTP
jgi:outer membrane protein